MRTSSSFRRSSRALQARLDRLDPAARDVVSLAAVIGRTFGLPLLEKLVPREQLLPALTELQRLDLIYEKSRYQSRIPLSPRARPRGHLLEPRRVETAKAPQACG